MQRRPPFPERGAENGKGGRAADGSEEEGEAVVNQKKKLSKRAPSPPGSLQKNGKKKSFSEGSVRLVYMLLVRYCLGCCLGIVHYYLCILFLFPGVADEPATYRSNLPVSTRNAAADLASRFGASARKHTPPSSDDENIEDTSKAPDGKALVLFLFFSFYCTFILAASLFSLTEASLRH